MGARSPHLIHGADCRQPSLADEGNSVAGSLHLFEDVGRQEHGGSHLAVLQHQLDEQALHQGVQAAGGLIEEQHLGFSHEGAHQAHLLLGALGHLPDLGFGIQLEPFDELVHVIQVANAIHLGHEGQECDAGHVVGDGYLAGQIPEVSLDLGSLLEAI